MADPTPVYEATWRPLLELALRNAAHEVRTHERRRIASTIHVVEREKPETGERGVAIQIGDQDTFWGGWWPESEAHRAHELADALRDALMDWSCWRDDG